VAGPARQTCQAALSRVRLREQSVNVAGEIPSAGFGNQCRPRTLPGSVPKRRDPAGGACRVVLELLGEGHTDAVWRLADEFVRTASKSAPPGTQVGVPGRLPWRDD
jgi:hypothetical protein